MGLREIKFEYSLNAIDCARCGVVFGVTPDYEERRRTDHQAFHCPSGHSNVFNQETALQKEQHKSQMLADQVRMEREQREKAERQLKRVQKGSCPKCNRHFVNVERHMQTKHAASGKDRKVK